MKILLITPLYPGYLNQSKLDATYAVHYIAREWAKNHQVKVLRPWPCYPGLFSLFLKDQKMHHYKSEEKFFLDGVEIIRAPITKLPAMDYSDMQIKRVAHKFVQNLDKTEYPDMIVCDTLNPSIYIGKIIADKCNSPLVASLHNTDIKYLSKGKHYKRYISVDDRVNRIVFRSRKIEKEFIRLYQGKKKHEEYFYVPFGINKGDVISKDRLMEKIDRPSKTIVVAASLKRLKKIDVLIDAFAGIQKRNGYVLKIIGDGPERNRLERQVANLGLESCVYFEGEKAREQVLHLMEESDIFVLVSSPETFGLVYVEAMAKGCITIGSKGEGIDGVIVNNENGYLCTPGKAGELQLALEQAMNLNRAERKRLIDSALDTAKRLNYEDLAERYLQNLRELSGSGSR